MPKPKESALDKLNAKLKKQRAQKAKTKKVKDPLREKLDKMMEAENEKESRRKPKQNVNSIDAMKTSIVKEREKGDKKLQEVKKRKGTKQLTNLSGLKRMAANEEKLYNFFAKLTKTKENEVVNEMIKFSKTSRNNSWFMMNIKEDLPVPLIKEFAEEVTDLKGETRKSIQELYKSYVERPGLMSRYMITGDDDERSSESSGNDDEKETERLRKILEGLDDKSMEEEVVKEKGILEELGISKTPGKTDRIAIPQKHRQKIVVDENIENVSIPKWYQNVLDNIGVKDTPYQERSILRDVKCNRLYMNPPWIDGNVTSVYLSEVENPDDWEERDINKYVHLNELIVKNDHWNESVKKYHIVDEKFLKANQRFFDLQCGKNSSKRIQTKDILTLYDDDDNEIKLRVLYQLDNGKIIPQTEKIFRDELAYISSLRTSRKEKIEKILNEKLTKNVEELGRDILSQRLLKVSNNETYKPNSSYMESVMETLAKNSQTVGEFAEKIGGVIVYIDLSFSATVTDEWVPYEKTEFNFVTKRPEKSGEIGMYAKKHKSFRGANIFLERLKGMYYLPSILTELSAEEKLPEIIGDPSLSEIEKYKLMSDISADIFAFKRRFAEIVYVSRNPTERRKRNDTHMNTKNVKMNKWMSSCVNADDVKDASPRDIIYYKEGKMTYCLKISELLARFSENNYKNPISGENLSESFIAKFEKLYNPKLVVIGTDEDHISDSEEKSEEKSDMSSDNEKEPVIFAPNLIEILEESIRKLEEGDIQKSIEKDETESLSESEAEFERLVREKIKIEEDGNVHDIKPIGICAECDNKLRKKHLKSIKYENEQVIPVGFCNFECFEKHEKWTKKRKRSN